MTGFYARVGLVFVSAALSVTGPVAQAQLPDTPAARQLARWLETFNQGDRDARQRFVTEQWPSRSNQNVDQDLALRAQTGGFILLRVEESTTTRTAALAQ